MHRLGYDRYGTEGGDLGAYVAPEVAGTAPDRVVGVYVISGLGFPAEADVPGMTEDERAAYALMMQQDWAKGVDHHALLRAAPQTFAYSWDDSPAGALAWMVQKFHEFNPTGKPLAEVISRDLLLTNVSVYWLTGTFGSSSWPMYDSSASGWPEGQKTVPTGVYSGPPGIRRLAEEHNTIARWGEENPAGHHFIAMDQPCALAADIRAFFAQLR
jgi:pimeloyl-ACP methyl ester carboxylesterase